jgi:hypothetical protein
MNQYFKGSCFNLFNVKIYCRLEFRQTILLTKPSFSTFSGAHLDGLVDPVDQPGEKPGIQSPT